MNFFKKKKAYIYYNSNTSKIQSQDGTEVHWVGLEKKEVSVTYNRQVNLFSGESPVYEPIAYDKFLLVTDGNKIWIE